MKFSARTGSTCVAALVLAAHPLAAQTRLTEDSTTPLDTASAGNITIARDAELDVAGGVAVTVNSSNSVTLEDVDDEDDDDEEVPGRISLADGDGATAILVQPGVSTTISNSGTITVFEDFEPADEDTNGIADGPIASGTERFGIRVAPGGTVTGTIASAGSISVEGRNSAGIALDSRLDGSLLSTGTIFVAGDDSSGIRTQDVTGDVVIEGSVRTVGRGSVALSIDGDVGGSVRIQGGVGQQRSFTYDEDGNAVSLSRFDLRVGAPAAEVRGNVAGGIVVAARPPERDEDDDDEDNNGVDDADEGLGSIAASGDGPALLIGSARNIRIGTLGAVDGGHSLAIEGTLSGTAPFSRTDAYGLVIGGEGGTVDMPGGIGISGSVSASTQDSAATAILVNAGATVPVLVNSGTISASIASQGEGSVIGIRDLSGTLTRIENSGFITASASSTDIAFAIDLETTGADITLTQFMNADDLETRAEIEEDLEEGEEDSTVYTAITGNIRLGSGNDRILADAGQISGDTHFGAGDDRLELSGDVVHRGKVFFGSGAGTASLRGESVFTGTMDFGGNTGAITIADDARFTGHLTNAANASVSVQGGTFGSDEARTTSVGTLHIGAGGSLDAFIDGDTGTASQIVADTAVLEPGARVSATITTLEGAEGSYVILRANSLSGAPGFDAETTDLPYIYQGQLTAADNQLVLDIRRKTAAEAGVTRAAASAYDAILTAALEEEVIAQSFLDIDNRDDLQAQLTQMLPDHAGGLFDAVTRATRLVARRVGQGSSVFSEVDRGEASLWLEPLYWRGNRDETGTSSYRSSGWGLTGGAEWLTSLGFIGGSYALTSGDVDNNGGSQAIGLTQHEFGLFWRAGAGTPLRGYARIGAGLASFSSSRTVTGTADDSSFTATSTSGWNGWLVSGIGGATYDLRPAGGLIVQPRLELEWFRLAEESHGESGAGTAVDLEVDRRTSQSLSGLAALTLGYAFGAPGNGFKPYSIELEAGRRTILAGSLGTTSARFEDGETFAITPDRLDDSWTAEARLSAGGWGYRFALSAGAESAANSQPAYSARLSFSAHF